MASICALVAALRHPWELTGADFGLDLSTVDLMLRAT